MKKTKIISLLIVLVMALSLVTGCGISYSTGDAEEKEKVTVALWGNQLLENYTQYLCDTFPDVEFEFFIATNSTDYYRYLSEHGDMPDILTVRRFSLRDAAVLKNSLYDLGDSELALSFYETYLQNYTYDDGTVNWLPVCAEVDSIIINKTLFEEYDIPIPTDYESFIYACKAFESVGIRGFVSDFDADYTCTEILQGFSGNQLLSMEGREWRMQYESGETNQLSEDVWLPVFEKFFDLKNQIGLDKDDIDVVFDDVKNLFREGKVAMYRGTGNDVVSCPGREGDQIMLLPYFGDTEKENWYLTYPAFQIAAGKQAENTPEREQLILDIMSAMINQSGQINISYGENMVSYNKRVELELLPELENLKPYIDANKMYIRLASNDMFSISLDVVHKILTEEIRTPEGAFMEFNRQLEKSSLEDNVVAHISTGYSNEFTDEYGNQAASAICNTIRNDAGADLMLAQGFYFGNIYEGDYTETEIGYICGGAPVVRADMTGEQIYKLIETALALNESRGTVCNDSALYVSSGFEMDITKKHGEYTLNALTVNGEKLDKDKTYSILVCTDIDWVVPLLMESVGCSEYNREIPTCSEYIYKHIVEDGGQLDSPTDYITIR